MATSAQQSTETAPPVAGSMLIVANLTALSALPTSNLTFGTLVWVTSEAAAYQLSSNAGVSEWNSFTGGGGGGTITSVVGTAGQIGAATLDGVVTLTNLAGFTADTTLQLNNSTPAAVNAWRSVVALAVATAGSERSTWTTTMLRGGAAEAKLVVDGSGWLGVGNPAVVNIGNGAAGTAGVTVVASGSNGATVELKMTTPTASLAYLGAVLAYNGPNPTAGVLFSNNTSTADGAIEFHAGAALGLTATITSAGMVYANAKTVSLTNGDITLAGTSVRSLLRTGGELLVRTTTGHATYLGANAKVGITLGPLGTTIGFLAVADAGNSIAVQNITGSRGGNAALASLLTALAAFGLITDGTS